MAPALQIDRRPLEDGVELRLRGELDLSTVPLFRAALRELRDEDVARVRLDISGLDFVDSTGLRALLVAHRESSVAGWKLALTRAQPHVQQMFELTRTQRLLPFEDD